MNYTEAYTTFGLKCALAPEVPNNEGSFRPVTITAPPGCILNCLHPSPVAARHVVGQWLPAAVHGALAQAVPDRVLAEGSSNLWNTQFNGQWSDGRRFSMLFFSSGGMGARPTKDGLSSTAFPSGVHGTPAEIVEARAPLLFVKRELRADSGGPGRYRGGLGHWLVIKGVRAGGEGDDGAEAGEDGGGGDGSEARAGEDGGGNDDGTGARDNGGQRSGGGAGARGVAGPYRFSPFFDRTSNPARGYAGGLAGAPGVYHLRTPVALQSPGIHGEAESQSIPYPPPTTGAGIDERPNPKATVWVEPDTEIVMGLPGGGGFGDPLARDPQRVREDVLNELVSVNRAREDYGVVLDASGDVDDGATARCRAARRAAGGRRR
jgi:N-methylhydantoinase B